MTTSKLVLDVKGVAWDSRPGAYTYTITPNDVERIDDDFALVIAVDFQSLTGWRVVRITQSAHQEVLKKGGEEV